MRNVFDQYDQPENKLTHALISTLSNDTKLVRPFLEWIGVDSIPPVHSLRFGEQQVPGIDLSSDGIESKGLPDACIFDNNDWAVLFESKVQAHLHIEQLRNQLKTASRHGYSNSRLVVITTDHPKHKIHDNFIVIHWRDIYRWFSSKSKTAFWARMFINYLQVFEAKMIRQEYQIRGTLTMFDGLHFNTNNPYTYREGRRLIKLLGDELQKRTDHHKIGVDPQGKRRPAITGSDGSAVWDFLPLKKARSAKAFTDFPHLTIAIRSEHAIAAVTVPNGVKGAFKTKLKQVELKGFQNLISRLEKNLRPILRRSRGAKPILYVTQRHYKTQRSTAEMDARIDIDLRTIAHSDKCDVKFQPEWIDAVFNILTHKRSNIQLGIEMRFKYNCPLVRSRKVIDLFADTWKALEPLVSFVL
jgi:hypothetical protein